MPTDTRPAGFRQGNPPPEADRVTNCHLAARVNRS